MPRKNVFKRENAQMDQKDNIVITIRLVDGLL